MRTATRALLVALALVTGCTRYEYRITEPPDLSRHIGTKNDQFVALEPIEYRMRTVENRLVIRAFNASDEPVELLGAKSFVVDPGGQSHPMRGQTIAPRSFIKMILPPIRPRVYDPGPNFGVGLGVGISHHHHRHHHHRPFYHSHLYDEPRYFYLYDEDDVRYWDWNGEGHARATFVYRRGGGGEETFTHAFTFKRIKM